MIFIVDYGMGNLRSVQKGLESVGFAASITSRPEDIEGAAGVVLPGVGAFGDAMNNLRSNGMDQAIRDYVRSGRPFLGICLGQHLIFDGSEEFGWNEGLGLLPGRVIRLPAGVKVPHIGWNQLRRVREEKILNGIPDDSYFYFNHSFYLQLADSHITGAVTEYGSTIPAVVSRGNIYGIQFHPEKSSTLGLKILQNFGELVRDADHTRD
ncbi:MAG: imidazole glycerol phosphate synthase subunit HisH [Firmicutes bacterium]|nr:imidazole glycerol phosphate synthase subunit HisH [Bacillota bacterium]